MAHRFSRSEPLFGAEAIQRLQNASVAVFGIGGVGSYAAEALVRGGVGNLTFIDADRVDLTNLNRQLVALESTLGRFKAEVMKERALLINPEAQISAVNEFFSEETLSRFDFSSWDYVVDAIDSVNSKVLLITRAKALGVPVISCMGAGNKTDPTAFTVCDLFSTCVCPLARVMRQRLRKAGVESLDVVFSREEPRKTQGSAVPASASFVPGVCGLIAAGKVIQTLVNQESNGKD